MTTIELSPECLTWQVGDATKHPPVDCVLLEAISRAGFLAFTGPSGLCGGKSEKRSIVIVHRGRGVRWVVVFREDEADVVTTTDLSHTTAAVLSWLNGKGLSADENSLHTIAG